MRPQPIPGELSVAIREFRQIGFAGEITLAGNAGDEVIGGLHAVTSPGRVCCANAARPRPQNTPDR